ncbi:MAG: autotransporter-associated beta strand repeat-containing protein [Pirellulaceae bacterium]|nr:autotransporter-associated beta strand repeat-containing protein [Pirellulaceae bacterium]
MKRQAARPTRRREHRTLRRLLLESLEDRQLLATINVPFDQPTVQAAVNVANPNDEIVLADGVYTESVNLDTMFMEGNITIRALNAGMATIDGGAGSAISASTFSGNITIEDLVLDQNLGNVGGVLNFVDVSGTITVDGSTFAAGFGGDGIYVDAGNSITTALVVTGSTFLAQADSDDMVLVEITDNPMVTVNVNNSIFTGGMDEVVQINVQNPSGPAGPTLMASITGNMITGAADSGDAIAIDLGDGTSDGTNANITIANNTITDAMGDAISVDLEGTGTNAVVSITNNTISGADDNGVRVEGGSPSVGVSADVTISDNMITNSGASGIRVLGDGGVGPMSDYNVVIDNNTVTTAADHGIAVETNANDNFTLTVELVDNTVAGTIGMSAYLIEQEMASIVNLKQGASASLDPATVIADNNNTGAPITIMGTVNVLIPIETDIALVGDVLTITDSDGADSDDTLTIQSDVPNSRFIISDPNNLLGTSIAGSTGNGTNTVTIPFAGINSVVVNTLGGDDTLTVSYALGNFGVPLSYNGGTQNTMPNGDTLVLAGGGLFALAIYNFANANDGTVQVSGNGLLTYTGLEPISSTITASDVTLNYSATGETLTVTNPGGGMTTVTSDVAAETITFNNPSGTLTINAGDTGDDIINISSLAANYPAAIVLDGQGGNDTVSINAAGGLSLTDLLDIRAENVLQSQPISGTGPVRLVTSTALFNQNNSYTAGTTLSQGTLMVTQNNSLGTGPVTLGDSSSGSAAITLVTAHGGGDVIINEPITVSAMGTGTVTIGGQHTGGRAFYDGLVTLNRDVTLRGAGNDRTQFRGGITGTGNVTVDGGGRVTWSTTTATAEAGDGAAPYDFVGSVTITGSSRLQTNSNFTAGSSSLATKDFTINAGSRLIMAYDTDVTIDGLSGNGQVDATASSGFPDPSVFTVGADNGSSTYNGTILNGDRQISLVKTGSGTITLAGGAGNNTYTGLTHVQQGLLAVGGAFGGDGAIRGNITVESGGTYRMLQDNVINNTSLITLSGTGTLDRNGRTDVIGALAGSGQVIGGGTLVMALVSGTQQTFSGTVTGGSLSVRGDNDNGTSASQILTGTSTGLGSLTVQRGNSANDVPLLVLAGGGSTTTGSVAVGQTGSGQGMATMNIQDTHTLNTGTFFLGEQNGHAGFVNQTGGTVNASGHMRVGHWPNETSVYTLDSGSISITGTPAGGTEQNGGLYIGIDGTGIFNHNGGDISTRFLWLDNRGATTGTDEYNMTGGLLVLTHPIGIGSSNPGSMQINLGGGTIRTDVNTQMTAPGILTGTNGDTTFNTNGNSFNVTGSLSGGGGLVKTGGGTMTLGAANSFMGSAVINGGTLLVNGSTAAASPIMINATGTLGGTGNAAGTVTLNGGTIAPGTSPGILSTGSVDMSAGGVFSVELEGASAGNGAGFHDQLAVSGTVALGNGAATLSLSGAHVPAPGDDFVIIANDGAEDTTGFFAGLPEGSELTFNGVKLYITYNGGDGNDVVLNTGPVVSGTSGSDTLEVTPLPGGDLQYQFLPGGPIVVLDNPTSFTFNGRGGDDVMIVQANGNPYAPLNFNGGGQDFTNPPTPSNGDLLQVFGSGQDAAYSPSSSTTGDGTVAVSGGGTIMFTGLEPVDMSGFGLVTFSPAGANDILAIDNGFDAGTGLIPALVVSGTTGGVPVEALHAWNNTTLAIDTSANDGTDAVTINSASNANVHTNLQVLTGLGADTVTVSGNTTFPGTVTLNSGTINVNAPITAGPLVDLDASVAITTSGPATDIVATLLQANSAGGINLDTNVDTIEAAGSGLVTLDESSAVTLTNVTSNNNPIAITAGGTVTVENADAGTSLISISVSGGSIVSGPADPGVADIVGATMNLTLNTAGNNLGVSPANRLEINADVLTASTNGAALNNAFIVDTAGGLQMHDSSVGGQIGATFDLLVLNGNLTSVVGGPRDIGGDIIELQVTGVGTIGTSTAAALEINALSSTTATTAGGSIWMRDTITDFPVALINANGGNVDLRVNAGDLLSVAGDPGVADVVGNVVVLRVDAAGNTIGVSAANRFELDANILQVQALNSSAFLVDTAGGLALRDSTVGPGVNVYDLLAINGGIVSEVVNGVRDVGAGILILETTGIGGIGISTVAPLEINAETRFDATTNNENIFVFDPVSPLPLGIVTAGTANVDLRATGPINDANGVANNLVANAASLRATAGIGSGNALETQISMLAASNTGGGNIEILNSVGGLLTIGMANGFSGITNTGGAVSVTNLSPLTIAANITAAGPITQTATDSAAPGDDLTVNAGVTINSTGSSVTLNAGDDALIDGNLSAATIVTINGDDGDLDLGVGTTVTINGVVTTSGGAFVNGNPDNDTFNLAMQTTSSFTVDGRAPSFGAGVPPAVGDTLNLAFGAATDPTLTIDGVTAGSGTFTTSSGEQPVTFTDIEQFDTSGPFHLVVDRSAVGLDGDVIDAQLNGADLEIRVNGGLVLSAPQVDILSLTMIGSSNDETFSITETASGLPSFLTTPPSFIPGSNGGHLNPTASLRMTGALGAPPALTDVSVHIDGGNAGDLDDLLITLISGHDVLYASDTLDSANSGNIGIVSPPFAGPAQNLDLLLSFANLEPITLVGAGGGLLLDASSTPATTALMIADAGAPGDGVSIVTGNGGFEDTTFSGFNVLAVVSGTGSETVTLASVDPAPSNGVALGLILIDTDNATGTDTAADVINVWSLPATVSLQAFASAGDDSFNLFDPGSTVDNIAGPVQLDGQSGSDTLTVLDTGDATGDTVLITETTIEGMTSHAGMPDIIYAGIEQLDVTTSSGNDQVTIDMTSGGSSLMNAVISAAAGDDQLRLESFITGLSTITLNGNAGNDTFNDPTGPPNPNPNTDPRGKLEPSLTTTIFVNGESGPTGSGNPTNPPDGDRDTFNLDVTVLVAPVIVDTVAGIATSAGPHQNVHFSGMEDLCLDDVTRDDVNINIGELYVRTTNDRERITYTSWNDTGVKLRIDNLDLGTSTTFPEHFGLAGGVQMLQRIVTFAQGGDDLVSIAAHVVDGNNDPIPVEFHGEDGDDYLTGANGDDILVGGPGRDRVLGGEGDNQLYGDGNVPDPDGIPIELPTDGNDNVSGRGGNDIIFGGGGIDQLFGSDGDDYIHAGSGNDLVDGGLGDDVLIGAAGNDNLSGNYGNDILLGGAGDDQLLGRQGDDVLLGGSDLDRVRGDAGNDLIVGGNAANVSDATTDAALRSILADWVMFRPAVPAGLGTLLTDGFRDLLIGDQGADAFHRSMLPDLLDEDRVYDFRAGDGDSLL